MSNGLSLSTLVPVSEASFEGVAVPTWEFDVNQLVETIQLLKDRELLARLENKALAGGPGRVDPEEAARVLALGIRERLDS